MANDLVVSVGASIRDLERQMKAAAKVAEQRADEIESTFRKANPSLSGDFGLGVLKGAIAAISFERITRGLIDANKEIASFGDTARRVGLELARFQELRLAAQGQGISGKEFDAGIQGFAKALNEARTEENELTRLLDANSVKYKDRKGEIISTNEALAVAADLISRAATEQDKLEIAEKLSIPKEFVPLLEGGADALNRLAREAGEAGTILDSEVIAKAKAFDDAWSSAWTAFANNAKGAVITAGQGLAGLLSQAADYVKSVNAANTAAVSADRALRAQKRGEAFDMGLGNAGGREAIDAGRAAEARARSASFRQSEIDFRNRLKNDQTLPPPRPSGLVAGRSTELPSTRGGRSAGGSSKSEDEQAQQRLERYIETLMRQNSVLDAEIATVGKSNAEKRAAVELAKAQTDLAKLDEESRQKVIASLTREIELSEQKRKTLKSLEDAQKGLRDAQKFFGDAAVDALEDLIVNGAKAEDVVKNLAASLAKAALQAALLGSGPLAGLFGTSGTGGNVGGLFGALFGRATGGHVNAGQAYRVGERGPETFVPTTTGRIVPAARGGGFSDRRVFHIDARGAQAGVAEQITQALRAYDAGFERRLAAARGESARRTGRY